jgi:hypothetical protein
MVKVKIISLILFFCFLAFPQEIKIKVSTDKNEYKIGDYIHLKYEFKHKNDINIFFPSFKDSLKKLELISMHPVKKNPEENITSSIYEFVLIGFDSGRVTIPAFSISYKSKGDTALSTIVTDSIVITIHSIKVDIGVEIKDIKEPERIPFDWKSIALWILILSASIILLYFLYKKLIKKKQEQTEEPKISVPPSQIALDSLKQLELKKLWQNGKIKEYHTEITEIIRKYFEEQFSLPALELTTSEVLYHLKNRKDTLSIVDLTNEFLSNADMVKFAKYIPLDKINEEMMLQAVSIVEESIQKTEPPNAENLDE